MSAVKDLGGLGRRPGSGTGKWQRAPWWARMFGYAWRRVHDDRLSYRWDYRTKKQLAREFLAQQFASPEEGGKYYG